MSKIVLDRLQAADVPTVVAGHMRCFQGFFLSKLGPRVLSAFYMACVREAGTVAIVARAEGRVIGCAVGCLRADGWYRRLVAAAPFKFVFAGAGSAVRMPTLWLGLIRKVTQGADRAGSRRGALLASIFSESGQGAGGELLEAWEASVRRAGEREMWLTTDAENNGRVRGFYIAHGWQERSVFQDVSGRLLIVMSKGGAAEELQTGVAPHSSE